MTEASVGAGLSRFLTWPTRHVRWKIVVPYAFLTVMLAIAGSYIATQIVTGSLEERFDNQLAEAGRVVSDDIVRKERQHLEIVRSASFTEGVAEAVSAGDTGELESLLLPIVTNSAVERLEVLDASGERLQTFELTDASALTFDEISDGDEPAGWQLVQRSLAGEADELGDKYAQVIETTSGFYFYTSGVIANGDKVAGVVLVGTRLDSLVASLQEDALTNVTIYDFEGVPLATTFAGSIDSRSDEAVLDVEGEALAGATAGSVAIRETRTLFGREYDLLYGRLVVRGQAVGLYSVGLPTDFIFSAGSTTRTQVALLFGVGMAAVLGIGFYLAHQLTSPILRLVRTARMVASGDLSARSGVRTRDEIGTLATSFDDMTARLQRQHLGTIKALTSAIDARDPYTLGHSVRVGQLATTIGRHMRLDDRTLNHLEIGGYLHDIGKIGIRDAVLLKPGKLTDEERAAIEEHPTIGLNILESVELPERVLEFVGSHHEKLDGSGYPRGLKEDEIPMVARVAAVSDMYDAVTTHRPYRDPMSPYEALAMLRSEAGRFLDREVVEAFAEILEDWEHRRATEKELRGYQILEQDPGKVTA